MQTLTKEETQDFIKQYYSNPHNARLEQMIQECKQSVIQSIVVPFGLGKILAAYDKAGGNVDTVHNVREGVYATDKEKEEYKKHIESGYNHKTFHQENEQYQKERKVTQSIKNGEITGKDAYTNEEINAQNSSITLQGKKGGDYRPMNPSIEHKIAAKTIWGDAGVILAEIDPDALINMPENLVLTTTCINSLKNDKEIPEFLNEVPQKINEISAKIEKMESKLQNTTAQEREKLENKINKEKIHLSQLKKVDSNKEQILTEYKKVKEKMEARINSYYTSGKFFENIGKTSVLEGSKMGVQQALGLIMVEFFTAVLEEVEDIFKKGFYTCENFFESLKIRLKKIARKVKRALTDKYQEIVKSFSDGFMSGVLSNLTTTIINVFKTTSAKLVRIIREGIFSFFKAIKLVLFPPENLTQEQVWHEAKKLIISGLIIGLGVLIEQGIKTFLISLGLVSFADILTSVFIGILTGIFIAVAMYWLDTNQKSIEQMRYEEISKLCAENLPQLIEEREELEKLIESTHKERLITLDSSFAECSIAMEKDDYDAYTKALQKINALWGAELKIKTIVDVKEILEKPNRTGCLEW